jgi:hypothetical protein
MGEGIGWLVMPSVEAAFAARRRGCAVARIETNDGRGPEPLPAHEGQGRCTNQDIWNKPRSLIRLGFFDAEVWFINRVAAAPGRVIVF